MAGCMSSAERIKRRIDTMEMTRDVGGLMKVLESSVGGHGHPPPVLAARALGRIGDSRAVDPPIARLAGS